MQRDLESARRDILADIRTIAGTFVEINNQIKNLRGIISNNYDNTQESLDSDIESWFSGQNELERWKFDLKVACLSQIFDTTIWSDEFDVSRYLHEQVFELRTPRENP